MLITAGCKPCVTIPPVNSTSSLVNWQPRKGSQHYEELTSWSYSKKIWKFLSLLKTGWEDNLCRKTSCTWTVFLNTARYSLKRQHCMYSITDTATAFIYYSYNVTLHAFTAKTTQFILVICDFSLDSNYSVSHLRFQLLLHLRVLLLGHGGFTFSQFVHFLSWALKVRLWGCWRNLKNDEAGKKRIKIPRKTHMDKLNVVWNKQIGHNTASVYMSVRSPTHYQASIVLCFNQSVM